MTHWQRDHTIWLWLLLLIVAFLTDCSTGTWVASGGQCGSPDHWNKATRIQDMGWHFWAYLWRLSRSHCLNRSEAMSKKQDFRRYSSINLFHENFPYSSTPSWLCSLRQTAPPPPPKKTSSKYNSKLQGQDLDPHCHASEFGLLITMILAIILWRWKILISR